MKNNEPENNILDWEELSQSDQKRAEELLRELNELFDRNMQRKRKYSCEDSTLED